MLVGRLIHVLQLNAGQATPTVSMNLVSNAMNTPTKRVLGTAKLRADDGLHPLDRADRSNPAARACCGLR